MLDVWRGTLSPRTLLNLIDHLPRTSAYQQAVADDDELADSVGDLGGGGTPSIPLAEFSPEVEALAMVVDRLGEVAATILAVNNQKPKKLKPYPRPVTAFDRVRARRRQQAISDLERRLFPDDS